MMGFSLTDRFRRKKEGEDETEVSYWFGLNDIRDRAQSVYLKRMALDTCANFVARAISQSEFKTNDKPRYYKLNVRPNTDMSATQFWQDFVYRLIVDNQVLVVQSDSGDLLIADRFTRNEYAVFEDTFEGVTVKDYTFRRTFRMCDVLYLEYNNEKLRRFTDGLFADYGDLYGRMITAAKRNGQVRGTVSVEGSGSLDDEKMKGLQTFINNLYASFAANSVAVVPEIRGFKYNELSNTVGTSDINMDEIAKIPTYLIDTVADAIGIPTALLHGSRAELKDNITAFNTFCLPPLLQKIEDELNAKTIEPREYSKETKIEVVGINRPDIFELATSIDKLISSGVFNANEIRRELGHDPRDGGDDYVRTKNYELVENTDTKGGER